MTKPRLNSVLKGYNYPFPKQLIAQEPARPRDSARLLVYDKKSRKTFWDTFKHLPEYIPTGSVLVFNQTRVFPARLQVTKQTGGKAELLYTRTEGNRLIFIADRKLAVDSTLALKTGITFRVLEQREQFYVLKPSFPVARLPQVLQKFGMVPLPPYIKHSKLTEAQRRKEYQAVFAKAGLSVAAPTASLHFTDNLLKMLKRRGVTTAFVTLNVGLGTFAPLTEHNLTAGKLHTEQYDIPKKTAELINKAKAIGKPVIAVGTTVVRTLESAARDGQVYAGGADTELFIRGNYRFKIIDGLITNFHVPKSSLLMLVAALIGKSRLLGLYRQAIAKKFRLFSFGDGMFIR